MDSAPRFTGLAWLNAGGIVLDHIFPILDKPICCLFPDIGPIRDQSRKLCKIGLNFACFWPPKFFRGGPSEFLDLRYKIQPHIGHVEKFHGDRPTELGDPVAKK